MIPPRGHIPCTCLFTLIVLKITKLINQNSITENNPHLEEDFTLMVSSCDDVISAEVANNLRDIAKSIKDKERFRLLSNEEALKELRDGRDEASVKFSHFLDRHGHRGYRELDVMHPPWRDNPIPCIKTIKVILTRLLRSL